VVQPHWPAAIASHAGALPHWEPEALEGDADKKDSARRRAEHKARQLCRQVQRALNLGLAERGSDPGLEQLYVVDVTSGLGCGHLFVHFVAPEGRSLPEVLASYAAANRQQIAVNIGAIMATTLNATL
jgi:hypothetical protein